MRVFKAMCPICHGINTTIRTSRRMSAEYQVLYCDCLNENCLTRFVVDSTVSSVVHTLSDTFKLSTRSSHDSNIKRQLNLDI